VKTAFRNKGDTIVVLDGLGPDALAAYSIRPQTRHSERSEESLFDSPAAPARELSSSEYCKPIAQIASGEPPAIDLAAEKRLQDLLVALAAANLIQSAHDLSDGGLAVAAAESCFAAHRDAALAAPPLSATISFDSAAPAEYALFHERGARAIVSVTSTQIAQTLETARKYGVAAQSIGQVIRNDGFRIQINGRAVIDGPLETLRDAWANSLEKLVISR